MLAVNAAAEAAGVCPGLTLADARALLPGLAVADHDPVAEGRVLDRLAEAAERYTPWTRVDHGEEGAGAGLWLDITGVAHLFGGEEMLLTDLLARLAGHGWTARAAVADTGTAAWAMARHATDIARPSVIVPEGRATAALAPLPVAALRLPPADAEALARLGLRRIGDLLSLPRPSLARRFGLLPGRLLDEALGRRQAPLSPRRPVAPHHARQIFAEPILEVEALAAALRRLVAALAQGLARRAEGARRLELACHRVDDSVCRLAIGTGRPSRDPDHLCRLFTEHLGGVDPGFGIEVMALSAPVVEPLGALQLGFAEVAASGPGDGLDALLDRLANRLGRKAVERLEPSPSHVPERAQKMVSAAMVPVARTPVRVRPMTKPPRPLRLLSLPEPIEAVAILPEAPPSRFRWRHRLHWIARAEGPERIAAEWWRAEDAGKHPRDYYRVEDREGRRFWLYRDRPYGAGAPLRWWLHGVFA